jgi:hypothetical protein
MFPVGVEEDHKYVEMQSMAEDRMKRILWIGCKIARSRAWLTWDADNHEFGTAPEYDVLVGEDGPTVLSLSEDFRSLTCL